MITIMSSLAQEESRSISENITWGKRRSMEEGKFSLAYKHFLGYKKGEDGILEIVEDEAKIIRKIYQLFLEGQTVQMIADHLTKQGIPTPMGKENWRVSTIMSILQNEKYKGDALLQKTYVADFLTKRVKKNCGRYRNTISRIPTRQSLTRQLLTWYKKRLNGGVRNAISCTAAARLQQRLSVGTVAVITVGKFGTATASTVNTFGVATKNTKKKRPVLLRIWTSQLSKQLSWKHLTGCWAIKNSILPCLRKCCRCSLIPVN